MVYYFSSFLLTISLLLSSNAIAETLTNLSYEEGVNEYQSNAIASGLTDELESIFGMWLTDSHFIHGDSECSSDCRQDLKFNIGLQSTSFDLNDDGAEEVFITLNHSLTCGSSGCDTYILQEKSEGWSIIYKGKEVRTILDEKSNGYYMMLDDMSKTNDSFCVFNKVDYECTEI